MKHSLFKGSDQTRFIKLNILVFFLVTITFFITGSSFAYAQNTEPNIEIVKQIVYGDIDTDFAQTYPPKVITILTKDCEETVLAYGRKVEDILNISDYNIDYNDIVEPKLDEYIASGSTIVITEVDVEVYTEEKTLPFETSTYETDNYDTGSFITEVNGQDGYSKDTIRIIYEDGIAVRKETIKNEIIQEPVTEVIAIGTRSVTIASCEYWGEVVDNITTDQTKREWFKYVMWRESGCDSGKTSYGSGAFKGLMQYLPSTFYTLYGGSDIWDGYEQILIASSIYDEKLSYGEIGWTYLQSQWPTATKEFRAGARYK
jgi:hypothetical protein